MSHAYIDGTVYHKRFEPTIHEFTYKFYLLSIDLSHFKTLKNRFFSQNRFNLFSFYAKDHFGKGDDFLHNVTALLEKFEMEKTDEMHFLTLPRIMHYTFNPISLLLIMKNGKPDSMLVEVHNYNGGRIVYPAFLEEKENGTYVAVATKDMYVSPFFDAHGEYAFTLRHAPSKIQISVALHKEGVKQLIATFTGTLTPFNQETTLTMFKRHTLLTFWVVTRTLWQSFLLWRKKLTWHNPRKIDQTRRY